MLPTRSFGKLLRTQATRPQVVLAGFIAGVLGFVPGFMHPTDPVGGFRESPGLILFFVAIAATLRVHLGLFGVALVATKSLGMALLPVSYALGQALVDSMTPAFAALRDTPLLAWCGPAHYATVGGLLLGLVAGFGTGQGMWFALTRVRQAMAHLEGRNDRYAKVANSKIAKGLIWLLLGRTKGGTPWAQLAEQPRRRNPGVRWLGAVAALALVGGTVAVGAQLAAPALRSAAKIGIEDFNGATVDLESAKIDLLAGRAELRGLAVADPERLTHDMFRAERLALALDTYALAQRRLVIDEVTAANARTGELRRHPAQLTEKATPPPAPPPAKGKERSLQDWLEEAESWQKRLQQLAHYAEYFVGGPAAAGAAPDASATPATPDAGPPPGWFARSAHESPAIAGRHPGVLIRKIRIDNIASAEGALGAGTLNLTAENISSHPSRVTEPMTLRLAAADGSFEVVLKRAGGPEGALTLEVSMRELPVDATLQRLGLGATPLRGGTVAVRFSGTLKQTKDGLAVDMPLQLTAKDTDLTLPGAAAPAHFDTLPVTLTVRGPLANPRIALDDGALQKTLLDAGKRELANLVQQHALRWAKENGLGDLVPGATPLVEGLINGDTKKVQEEAQKRIEAEAAAAKKRAEEEAAKAKAAAEAEAAKAKAAAEEAARKEAEAAKKKAEEEAKKKLQEKLQKELPGGVQGLWPPKK